MSRPYEPYIAQTVGEIMDKLGWMMLYAPRFEDDTGYFPGQGIETTFFALLESLKVVRKKLGEERYEALVALSHRIRAHFEADPDDATEDSLAGRALIQEMEKILTQRRARKPNAADPPKT